MNAVSKYDIYTPIHSIKQIRTGDLLAKFCPVGRRLGKVFYWLRDRIQESASIRELNRLNDHYLDDVGIARGDLDFVAYDKLKPLR